MSKTETEMKQDITWDERLEKAQPLADKLTSKEFTRDATTDEYNRVYNAYNGLTNAAHTWGCCAVGEQLDLTTLNAGGNLPMALKYNDLTLLELGHDFSLEIDRWQLDNARETYDRIRARIETLGGTAKVYGRLKRMVKAADALGYDANTCDRVNAMRAVLNHEALQQ